MTTVKWLMDDVIEGMTEVGVFGAKCRFVSFKMDRQHTGQDQFASTILYGTVTISDHEDRYKQHQLVIKVKHQSLEMRNWFKNDFQFHNEIQFYENIMPFLLVSMPTDGRSTLRFCHYFYGHNKCGDLAPKDIIVLENACLQGYRLCDQRLHLDIDHLVVAMKTLAKFHSMSYRAKHKNPVAFADMIHKIKEIQWNDENNWFVPCEILIGLFSVALNRLVERCGGEEDERSTRFRREFLNNVVQTMRRIMEPVEPFAVFCHGDFNRNNMMFLYDDSGLPTDSLPFDMANIRYGSPALDLSFFLYMNTDRPTRDAHWDKLLDIYCAVLAEAVSDVADVVRVPDREQLDVEIRERAFYGLAHVSFFVRHMMEEDKTIQHIHFIGKTDEEILKFQLSLGGDNANDVIADAIQHFVDIRYANAP